MIRLLHKFLDWALGLEKKEGRKYEANFVTATFQTAIFMIVTTFLLALLLNYFVFQRPFFVYLSLASASAVVVGIIWGSITGFLVYIKQLEPPTIILGPPRS